MSEAHREGEARRRAAGLETTGQRLNRILGLHRPTAHEVAVEDWLIERGVAYERQVPVGEHIVDFFLPDSGEALEADGAFWHQDQRRDIERDRALLRSCPGLEITHLHFAEARYTPPIDPEPLPGVRYVVCNPGPGSFVDPTLYVPVPILSRREWTYGGEARRGGWAAQLYDLSVEGVHSFLANGLIISNSAVEHGTGLFGPEHRKYLIEPHPPRRSLRWIDPLTGHPIFARRVWHPGSEGAHMVSKAAAVVDATFPISADRALQQWKRETETLIAASQRGVLRP